MHAPRFTILDAEDQRIPTKSPASIGHEAALNTFFQWLESLSDTIELKGIGHRVVHGGTEFVGPTLITDEVIQKIAALSPLAPLHQPHNLKAIQIIAQLYPKLPQVACFDTTFHRTQHPLAKLFAIPRVLTDEGIIRYGFHGISYEYIASILPDYLGEKADGKTIVAHLGNGASLCAMKNRKSVATSMGFTALEGLMMGSRCGEIDPGVLLYLLEEKKLTVEQLTHLLYQKSGLLGVSGISSDMRALQDNTNPRAVEAVDLFCYKAAREIGALCIALKGCDTLIFTAGIGENSSTVRRKICELLKCLGVKLDQTLNQQNAKKISAPDSQIFVGVIPTNEEYMIAKHTHLFL